MKKWWENLEDKRQLQMIVLFLVALFIVAAVPFFFWAALNPNAPYWLESLTVWWPVSLIGCCILAAVANVIYQNVRNK